MTASVACSAVHIGSVRYRPGRAQPGREATINIHLFDDKGKLEGVGQIASFPSRHPSGDMYRWVHAPWETSLEDAPEWLIELIEAPSAPKDYVSDGTRIRVGDRHDFLVHESARLRGMGYDAKTIRVLLHALYTERCELDPPMPPEEIDEIAEWFEDKAVNEFDTSWPGKKFKKAPITEDDDGSGWTYTGQTLTLGQTQFKEVALPFYDASSPLVFPEKQRWWGGRITHPSSILIHGDAKLGKTESTLRLLDSAFTGGSFLGDFTVGFTPKVLYLEEEGAGDMQAKLKAYGWTPDQVVALSSDDLFGLPWMSLAVSTLKYAVEHGFNLIVVDTLSTYFTVANGEKRDLYTTAQGFRALFSYAKRNGISVWAIHHDNASGSIYGRNEMAAQFDILVHHKFDETKDIDTWTFAGRYFGQPKPDPICYRYDKATGERHLISAEEIGEIGGVSPRTRNILDVTDYLKHHPEGVEWAEVSGFLGNTPRTTVQEYLDLAVERLGGRKQVGRGQGTKTRWYPDQEAL
jgi:hypothetical protein